MLPGVKVAVGTGEDIDERGYGEGAFVVLGTRELAEIGFAVRGD
jgi:hypothetical protein